MAAKKRKSEKDMMEQEVLVLSKERTLLSKERTILSFMQTGLAFIGIGILVINVFGDTGYAPDVVGWSLIAIGAVEILECTRRLIKYRKKMNIVKKELGQEMI
jgi:uncharacterized membrane protein YidH (DUF202 family)